MPKPTILHAGPISAKFADGQLRYLCVGDREIARRIYFAVRDDKWATPEPVFTKVDLKQEDDSFTITLAADCKSPKADYSWRGTITGTSSGEITFEAEGFANHAFRSNRIGICLLFGAEALAGQKFQTANESGEITPSEFPKLIPPVLLAEKFQELRYTTNDLMEVRVRLEGSLFGMEDQRNYGDSSYKAFAPLGYSYPEVPHDLVMRQKLSISVLGALATKGKSAVPRLKIGEAIPGTALPKITEADPAATPPPSFDTVNRHREKYAAEKVITISYNPTEHLRDDDTVMENTTAPLDQVRTIQSFAPEAAVRIGAITFAPKDPEIVEPRLETDFAAAWSLRILKALAASGAKEAAFGVDGSPAAEIRRELGAHSGATLVETTVEGPCHPLVDALCLEQDQKRALWLVNLTGELQEIALPGKKHPEALAPWEVREMNPGDFPRGN